MPETTPKGYIVYIAKLLDSNADNFCFADQVHMSVATSVVHTYLYGPPNGVVILVDLENVTFGHYLRVSLMVLKKLSHFLMVIKERTHKKVV